MDMKFEDVVDKLLDIIPQDWNRAIFMVEYTSGSYSMRCYYTQEGDSLIDVSKIPNASKIQIINTYKALNCYFQKCRAELVGNACWNSMTISFDKEGTIRSEFDYSSHEGAAMEYIEGWKKKYLG